MPFDALREHGSAREPKKLGMKNETCVPLPLHVEAGPIFRTLWGHWSSIHLYTGRRFALDCTFPWSTEIDA